MAAAPRRVLVVCWDAADWSAVRPLMRDGAMPHLERLVERGLAGPLAAGDPLVPAVAWTTLLTGRRPRDHRVLSGVEPDPDLPGELRPTPSTRRATPALWTIAARAGAASLVVGVPASYPAEPIRGGTVVSERFFDDGRHRPGVVEPASLVDALDDLRLEAADLGPADLLPFAPQATPGDPRLAVLASSVAHAATAHNVATWCLEHRPWSLACLFYPGLAHLSRAFGADHGGDSIYRDVVSAAYRFHDQMLGRLVALAGEDAAIVVCSAHGYRLGTPRGPRHSEELEEWHRRHGLFVAAGPGLGVDRLVEGASILDVAPTALALLGLSPGRDMPGRDWTLAPRPRTVDSWPTLAEDVPTMPADPDAARRAEVVASLRALGYAEPAADRLRRWVEPAIEQAEFNLARSLADAPADDASLDAAAAILERLARGRPDRLAYVRSLFDVYAAAGRVDDMARLLEGLTSRGYRGPLVRLGLGIVAVARREPARALEHLAEAARSPLTAGAAGVYVGRAYLRLRDWSRARDAFAAAADADADDDRAWAGLAAACLGLGDDAAAADHALRAVGLAADRPDAHHHLGVALARLGRPREAAVALERCVALAPDHLAALRRLVDLYRGPLRDAARARDAERRAGDAMIRRHARRARRAFRRSARSAAASAPTSR